MKLCLDQEEYRPDCLSLHFFASLMITEAKKYAVLQLLSFKKKRELVYSTKLNDGFFEVKVMMVQEAAKQIDEGLIKNYSIVQGWIRNHGEGVIVIKQKLKFWNYGSMIGTPIPWKLKKQNINGKGSNFIVWNSQQLFELHAEQQQTQFVNPIQAKQAPKEQIEVYAKKKGEQNIVQKEKPVKSLSNLTETQSIILQSKQKEKEQQLLQKQQIPEIIQKSQNNNIGSKISKQKKQEVKTLNNSNNIYDFLFQEDSDATTTNDVQNITIMEIQAKSKYTTRSHPVINLKTIFDCLNEDQEQNMIKMNKQQKQINQSNQQLTQNSQEQQVLQWFLKIKNQRKEQQRQNEVTLQKSSIKKKRQIYKCLIDQSQSDQQAQTIQKNKIQTHKISQNNIDQKNSSRKKCYEEQKNIKQQVIEVKFEDIYHGLFEKSPSNWEMTFIIRCMADWSNNNYTNAIITDLTSSYLMNATFINPLVLDIPLEEGSIYRVSGGLIKIVNNYNNWNSSHSQMQFDCSKCIISKLNENSQISPYEKLSNYNIINDIYSLQDNQIVNTMGVLKSVRTINGKTGMIVNFQIVDPIVKYGIIFTQFDAKINISQINSYINQPITIYNAYTNSFRGKKNIVSKNKTIVRLNWLPYTSHTSQIWQWIQTSSIHIDEIQINLVGYSKIPSLSRINACSDVFILVENVIITDINDKFSYFACVKCFKKVNQNRCRSCGKRNQGEIIQRLFLRGAISDSTSTLNVVWNNSIAQSIKNIGFSALKKKWILKKVSVWLQRGNNEIMTIMKLQQQNIKDRLSSLLNFIKQRLI